MLERELENHRLWHEKEKEIMQYDSNLIFTTKTGKYLEYGNTRRSLVRFYNKHDIEQKNFHVYRSTFCTNLCRAGVPIQTASKLMSHKSIEVTAKYYTCINMDDKQNAIKKLPDYTIKN